MTIAYAALVDGPPEAIAADAVHGESQLASIADAHPGAFQRIFNVHRGRGPCRPCGGGRHRVPDHGDGPQLGGNTSILQRHVGVSGRRCHPAQHGIFGELSPTVPCRDASVAGFFRFMAKATRGAHAEGQCSPAQVAAEEKGQAGNREGASQRPLMMRRGAMLAGSGCG